MATIPLTLSLSLFNRISLKPSPFYGARSVRYFIHNTSNFHVIIKLWQGHDQLQARYHGYQ